MPRIGAPSLATSVAPVERLTRLILDAAVAAGASDVRIEPGRHQGLVGFRVDGATRPFMRMPLGALAAVVAHVKALAALDVAGRLRPQHGSARVAVAGGVVDLRVSTVPARDMECAELGVHCPHRDGGRPRDRSRAPHGDLPRDGDAADGSSARNRVLLVHGDAGARAVVSALLASSGYEVEIAGDGAAPTCCGACARTLRQPAFR